MQIECATTTAASQVLMVLMDAHLRPGREFHMNGPDLPDPPIYFTMHMTPLSQVMRRFRSIAGAIITYEHGV